MMVTDWKCIALAASIPALVVLLASCSPSQGTATETAIGTPPAVVTEVAPAVIGNISVSTTYVASVEARNQVDLVPLVTGLILGLNVDVGSEVQKDQVIAELSHGTLDAQLRQAQAALLNAQAKLALVRAGVIPNRIKAQAQLDSARARLAQLVAPSPRDIQSARSAVEKATTDLNTAQTQLNQLNNPTELELASARAMVAKARDGLSVAQAQVDQAVQSRSTAVEARFGGLLQIFLIAHQDLETNMATLYQPAPSAGLTPREISAARENLNKNQEIVSNLLVEMQSLYSIPQDITMALWAEGAAQITLDEALAKLKELQEPEPNTVALAQFRVDAAQTARDAAEASLDLLQNPTDADRTDAETAVTLAEQTLAISQNPFVQHDIDAAQAMVQQFQGQVDLVNQQLSETRILAPFDGFVLRRLLSPGALASPQTPVVTVSSNETIVSMQLEERDINSLREDQSVSFSTPGLPGRRLELQIDQISRGADQRAHTFLVQLRPVETTPELRSGMSGQVSFETRHQGVVLVPKPAIVYQNNQPALYVVQDGRAQRRNVTPVLENSDSVEISHGVQAGEQVVVSGNEYLKDGDPVELERR